MIESLWPAQINAIIEAPFLRLVTRMDSSSSYLSELDKPYKSCPSCGAIMTKSKYNPSWVDEAEGLSAILDD